ncbi:MAG: hypothetical protein JW908_07690 [Anaerolineales bacterium]|nr:hypothetical protein [Anaerolineales bacterium]
MSAPKIEAYSFGMIRIDGSTYARDVMILPEGVISNWRRREGHLLIPEDIVPVFEAAPEILVVGTGSVDRMKISEAIKQETHKRGIQLICMPSGKAWQVYNAKANEKRVAGAFHLTC